MISSEKEYCEIISFKIGSCISKIAGLDLFLGNYQMMTLTSYVYTHFINIFYNDKELLKTFPARFPSDVNSLVQDNIIRGFSRSGVSIPHVNQGSYKEALNECLKEWNNKHKELSKNDKKNDISMTTTKMISEYFDSENIDYSDRELDAIYTFLNDISNRSDDDTFSDYMKASSGSGCLVIFLLLIPSIFLLINVIY